MNYTLSGGAGTTSVVNTLVTSSTLLTGLSIYKEYIISVRAMTVTLGNSSSTVFVSTNEDGMLYVIIVNDYTPLSFIYHSAWYS